MGSEQQVRERAPSVPAPDWSHGEPAGYVKEAFERLLFAAEREEVGRDGLRETPARAAAAWKDLTSGYASDLHLKTFDAEGFDEMVAVSGLPFYSLCEHHCLPFFGTADFVYLPKERILGLSKFGRLLEHYSRRLQVQEKLTMQMADRLAKDLEPRGVMVVVRASHLCMEMRGICKQGAETCTSVVRGLMKEDAKARDEAFRLIGSGS